MALALADQHMSYAARKPQSRAEADANARTLRNLVKMPDNRVCADCKRNDTRWAAWNIGCFLCIRCSGIHRSMGTHISRVKSIDLDMWTEEQMASVKKWGNKRVNLYWEANLKSGHVPPEHKMESFIRSKYESRRWAMQGPPPEDPSVLTGEAVDTASAQTPSAPAGAAATAPVRAQPKPSALLDFFSDTPASTAPPSAAAVTPATSRPAASSTGGLFDLDWDAGATASATPALKAGKGKQDILSLFSTPAPAPPKDTPLRTTAETSDPFAAFSTPAPGRTSVPDMVDTQDVWGAPATSKVPPPPANDAFADIWGDFQ